MSIHPTSVVDAHAEISSDVEIGPFVVIEAGVRIGPGCVIRGHAQLLGSVEVGEGCEIGHGSVVGGAPQDSSFDQGTPSGVRLGAGNILREHVTIHRSSVENGTTQVGCRNLLMAGAHVGHDVVMGDRNILANLCLLGGHVHLGNGAFLGGGAGIHQFVRIGDLCMVKGLSAITQDLPPYLLVSGANHVRGLNVVGMRRAGMSAAARQNVKEAYRQMYLQGLRLQDALDAAAEREWEKEGLAFIDFFRVETKRGIGRP